MPNKDDEQKIKNAILDYIRFFPRKGFAWSQYNGGVYDPKKGCYRKKNKYQRKGVPDIIGIWCQRPLFIEVKTEEGRLSEDQNQFIEEARSHGAIAFVCRRIHEAVKILESIDVTSSNEVRPPLSLKPCSET